MAAVSTRTFPEAFSKSVADAPLPELSQTPPSWRWAGDMLILFRSMNSGSEGRARWVNSCFCWLWVSVLSFHIPVQSVRRATPQSSGMSPCTFRGLWGLTSRNTSLQKECAVNKDNPDGSFSELTDHIQCLFVVLSRPKPVTFPLSLETPARSQCN